MSKVDEKKHLEMAEEVLVQLSEVHDQVSKTDKLLWAVGVVMVALLRRLEAFDAIVRKRLD